MTEPASVSRTGPLLSIARATQRWLGHFVVGLLALMVLNVTWQIFSRYLLSSPSAVTEELARYLLIWLGLFGGAYAASFDDHIALDLLPLSSQHQALIRTTGMTLFALVLIVGGAKLVLFTVELEQRSAALGFALGWVYVAAPLSGALVLLFALSPTIEPAAASESAVANE